MVIVHLVTSYINGCYDYVAPRYYYFLSGVGMKNKYSNEQLVKFIQTAANPTEYLEQLYIQNKGYIYKIASKYSIYTEIEDLMQEGYLGLYEAAKKYDNSQEVKFLSYAGFWIKQAITRYIINCGSVVRLPVHIYERNIKFKKMQHEFEMENGRIATDKEMAKLLNISLEEVQTIKLYNQTITSLDKPLSSSEETDLLLMDTIEDPEYFEEEVINDIYSIYCHTELWQLVKKYTTDLENGILQDHYIKNKTFTSIATENGLSRQYISSMHEKALSKLRRPHVVRRIREQIDYTSTMYFKGSKNLFKNTDCSCVERIVLRNEDAKEKVNSLINKINQDNNKKLI